MDLTPHWRCTAGDYVIAMDVSSDGRLGVAGLGDGNLLGFELASGREQFRRRAHAGGVLGTSFSPDGELIATCGQEPNAKLWRASGELLQALPGGNSVWVEHVAWSPTTDRLATAAGRNIRVWSRDGELLLDAKPLSSTVAGLAWRSDGAAIAAVCYGGVQILSLTEPFKTRQLKWKGSLISIAWSPDSKVVACGSQDSTVHFWRLTSGKDSEMSGYPLKPKALAWDRESKLLATGGAATVTVWDFRGKGPEGRRPIQLDAHQAVCTQLAFSPINGMLASGSQDASVLLWEPRKSANPIRFGFLDDQVSALVWHPREPRVIGADASGTICSWVVS
jgi:WD40 repeat protein